MSPTTATRWYIHRDIPLVPFGDDPHRARRWAVFPYQRRDENGNPIPTQQPTYFGRLKSAYAFAHGQLRRTYGRTR